jgi:hypothetical protein
VIGARVSRSAGVSPALLPSVDRAANSTKPAGRPRLEQDFSADTDAAAKKIATLEKGDPGVAILDALNFGINLLREQPPAYRRAVLLFSETIDSGSQTSFEDALRTVDDTNTTIYSFGFSSTKAAVEHEASKLTLPEPALTRTCPTRRVAA